MIRRPSAQRLGEARRRRALYSGLDGAGGPAGGWLLIYICVKHMSTRVGRRRRTASTKFQPAELLLVALATAASARPAAVNATHVARIGIGAVVTHVGLQLPPPSLRSSSLSRPSLTTTTCWRERGAGERRRGGWERRPWAMPFGGADC